VASLRWSWLPSALSIAVFGLMAPYAVPAA